MADKKSENGTVKDNGDSDILSEIALNVSALGEQVSELSQRLEKIEETSSQPSETIFKDISEQLTEIIDNLKQKEKAVETIPSSDISAQILLESEKLDELKSAVSEIQTNIDDRINAKSELLSLEEKLETLGSAILDIKPTLEKQDGKTDDLETFLKRLEDIENLISTSFSKMEEQYSSRIPENIDKVIENAGNIFTRLESVESKFVKFDEGISGIPKTIEETESRLYEQLSEIINRSNDKVGNIEQEIADSSLKLGSIKETIIEEIASISGTISQVKTGIQEEIRKTSEEEQKNNKTIESMIAAASSQIEALSATVSDELSKVPESLNDMETEFINKLDDVSQTSRESDNLLDNRLETATVEISSLRDTFSREVPRISDLLISLEKKVLESVSELTGKELQVGENLKNGIEANMKEIGNVRNAISDKLGKVPDLFEKLKTEVTNKFDDFAESETEKGAILEKRISDNFDEISTVGENLGKQVSKFSNSFEKIEKRIMKEIKTVSTTELDTGKMLEKLISEARNEINALKKDFNESMTRIPSAITALGNHFFEKVDEESRTEKERHEFLTALIGDSGKEALTTIETLSGELVKFSSLFTDMENRILERVADISKSEIETTEILKTELQKASTDMNSLRDVFTKDFSAFDKTLETLGENLSSKISDIKETESQTGEYLEGKLTETLSEINTLIDTLTAFTGPTSESISSIIKLLHSLKTQAANVEVSNLNDQAIAHFNNAEYDLAESFLKKAIEFDERIATLWANLGQVQSAREELDAAEESFRKAIDLNPELTQALAGLGGLLVRTDHPEETIEFLRNFILREDPSGWAVVPYSRALAATGQHSNAIKLLRKARMLDPGNVEVEEEFRKYSEEETTFETQILKDEKPGLELPEPEQAVSTVMLKQEPTIERSDIEALETLRKDFELVLEAKPEEDVQKDYEKEIEDMLPKKAEKPDLENIFESVEPEETVIEPVDSSFIKESEPLENVHDVVTEEPIEEETPVVADEEIPEPLIVMEKEPGVDDTIQKLFQIDEETPDESVSDFESDKPFEQNIQDEDRSIEIESETLTREITDEKQKEPKPLEFIARGVIHDKDESKEFAPVDDEEDIEDLTDEIEDVDEVELESFDSDEVLGSTDFIRMKIDNKSLDLANKSEKGEQSDSESETEIETDKNNKKKNNKSKKKNNNSDNLKSWTMDGWHINDEEENSDDEVDDHNINP